MAGIDQPICTLDARRTNGMASLARGCRLSKVTVERTRKWPGHLLTAFDNRLTAVVQMHAD